MPVNFTQWYTNSFAGSPESPNISAEPLFRDALDRQRSAHRRIPQAEYPDGYLGTVKSRRDDRMLKEVQGRANQRNYQRGVHKGERIDPGDYLWPQRLRPDRGLQLESQGRKFAPVGTLEEHLVAEGKMPVPRGAGGVIGMIDPKRAAQLRRLAPSWNP
jgi:hypothetical protein